MSVNRKPLLDIVLCWLAFTLCTHLVAQQTKESEAAPFKIEVKVNRVLVPVVVRDQQRRAVGTLTKQDFQVFDQDKPQVISGFAVEKRGLEESNTESGNQPAATSKTISQGATAPQRFIVFLFDDTHLSPDDLGRLQKLGIKMLAASLTGSDMAAVVSISGANSGLIRDRATLEEAILKLKSQPLLLHQGRQCPNM